MFCVSVFNFNCSKQNCDYKVKRNNHLFHWDSADIKAADMSSMSKITFCILYANQPADVVLTMLLQFQILHHGSTVVLWEGAEGGTTTAGATRGVLLYLRLDR